jgi:hypothetical protein
LARFCDGNGKVATKPDDTNKPTDPTGGCQTPGCMNGTQTRTPYTAAGTACAGSGVCNGSGACGACTPGASQCAADGKTIQNCSSDGKQWVDGTVCPVMCTSGQCTGACVAGNPMFPPYCSGVDQLHTCVGTSYNTMTCTNACSGSPGACTGSCKPSAATCSGNTVTWCDATGTPQSQACGGSTPVCFNGACVTCSPNSIGCCMAGSLSGTQTCTADGSAWGTCTACGNANYTCSAGTCSCNPTDPCATYTCGLHPNGCGSSVSCGPCTTTKPTTTTPTLPQ